MQSLNGYKLPPSYDDMFTITEEEDNDVVAREDDLAVAEMEERILGQEQRSSVGITTQVVISLISSGVALALVVIAFLRLLKISFKNEKIAKAIQNATPYKLFIGFGMCGLFYVWGINVVYLVIEAINFFKS